MRPVCPAKRVLVEANRLWPPARVRWGVATPLIVNARGVPNNEILPGLLTHWAISRTGGWCGVVRMSITVGDESFRLVQLVPAAALREAPPSPSIT